MRLQSGSRLGPYEISAPIGAGGMGEVYRARDTRLGREVAIKVLPHELSRDSQRLARFEREARSSSALNHPNIITIHDFTSTDGEAWLVMELIRGESLREVISHGPLPMKRVLAIGTGIAEGLAAAHAAGLVHRDLKPENVMLTPDGTAKILDFGLAKNFAMPEATNTPTDVQVSRAGIVMGTAPYMSPEQARGEEVDFRTDQFSLGLILYEMATGKNPFRRSSPVETLAAIINDEAPPLGEPLGWLVERCLQKNPAQRYGSTSDLAHDLRRLSVAPTFLSARTDKSVRATPWALATAALLIALVIAVVNRPRTQAAAPMQSALATPQIMKVNMREICPPVAISPDGRYVAIDGAGIDRKNTLWLHDLRSGTTKPIGETENAYGFAWSSDSRAIAYCAGGKLKTVSVDGTPGRTLCNALPPCMPAWRGDTILFADQTGISRIDVHGSAATLLMKKDPARPGDILIWPHILPDGKHFLYIKGIRGNNEIRHELMSASIDGGLPTQIASMDSMTVFANEQLLFIRDGTLLAQPFDTKGMRLTGEPHPLIDDLYYFGSTGVGGFSAADNGTLVWRTGRRPTRQVWLNRAGTEVGSIGAGLFASGRLSSDGNRYAAALYDRKQGTSDIWIYDLRRRTVERLTYQSTFESSPVWSPDGKTIYYMSDVLSPPDIFRWTLGEDHGTLLYGGPYVEQPEDVSPDGRLLSFVQTTSSFTGRIGVLPVATPNDVRLLTTTAFSSTSPRFSPDGKRLAYQSDISGAPEVYVRGLDGSEESMRVSPDGGTYPRWRKDGTELFFLAPGGRVMSVAVAANGTLGAPHMLFQAAEAIDFEPAPDGSRFLVQLEERSLDPPVHLMINWPARLAAH